MSELPQIENPFSDCKVIGKNIPSEVYLRQEKKRGDPDFIMSRSELMVFAACPEKWINGYKFEETDATELGTLMDIRVLQPEKFEKLYAVCPETYMGAGRKKGDPEVEKPWNRNATFCQEWEEEQERAGRKTIKADEETKSRAAVTRLFANERARAFIDHSDRQVLVIGQYVDQATELVIPVKTLIDIVPMIRPNEWVYSKCLGDFKTTRDASPWAWEKAIAKLGYHVQGSMNLDLYTAATGEDRCEFRHVIQENVFPWQVATRIVSDDFIRIGRMDCINALKRYCECLATNTWPDYDQSDRSIGGWLVSEPRDFMIK